GVSRLVRRIVGGVLGEDGASCRKGRNAAEKLNSGHTPRFPAGRPESRSGGRRTGERKGEGFGCLYFQESRGLVMCGRESWAMKPGLGGRSRVPGAGNHC